MKFSLATVLLASTIVSASVQTVVNNGNNNSNGQQSTQTVKPRRSVRELFRRDPDFEFAMSVLARNAEAAQQTVDQIVADIRAGTVHKDIEQAAIAAGIITGKKAHRKRGFHDGGMIPSWYENSIKPGAYAGYMGPREAMPEPGGHSIGPVKGASHTTDKLAQHIHSGGFIPEKIRAALVASPHYQLAGQGAPKGGAAPAANPAGVRGSNAGRGGSAGRGSRVRRDVDELIAREIDNILYEREADDLYMRDLEALYERDFDDALYARGAKVTLQQMEALVEAFNRDPKALEAGMKALNSDPNVEKMTHKLTKAFVKPEDYEAAESMEKRDVEYELYGRDYDSELFGRDSEFEIYAREAKIELKEMQALTQAMLRDPKALKAGMDALNSSPNTEKVTEDLVRDWVPKGDLE